MLDDSELPTRLRTLTGFEYDIRVPRDVTCERLYEMAEAEIGGDASLRIVAFAKQVPTDSRDRLLDWLLGQYAQHTIDQVKAQVRLIHDHFDRADDGGIVGLKLFVLFQ